MDSYEWIVKGPKTWIIKFFIFFSRDFWGWFCPQSLGTIYLFNFTLFFTDLDWDLNVIWVFFYQASYSWSFAIFFCILFYELLYDIWFCIRQEKGTTKKSCISSSFSNYTFICVTIYFTNIWVSIEDVLQLIFHLRHILRSTYSDMTFYNLLYEKSSITFNSGSLVSLFTRYFNIY